MSVSTEFLRLMFDENSDIIALILLEVSHPDMGDPARFALNSNNVWSQGNEYLASYFKPELPLSSGDEIPEVSLEVDNVDRSIIDSIRTLDSPPTVTLKVVTDTDPDTVEMGPFNFDLKSAEYDVLKISGTLGYEDILNNSFPAGSYTPKDFPGLFS